LVDLAQSARLILDCSAAVLGLVVLRATQPARSAATPFVVVQVVERVAARAMRFMVQAVLAANPATNPSRHMARTRALPASAIPEVVVQVVTVARQCRLLEGREARPEAVAAVEARH
jgi:hypothetical protein